VPKRYLNRRPACHGESECTGILISTNLFDTPPRPAHCSRAFG
jgi:hypothetical protein